MSSKITELAAQGGAALQGGDLFVLVDSDDLSMAATGTDKKISAAQLGNALKSYASRLATRAACR